MMTTHQKRMLAVHRNGVTLVDQELAAKHCEHKNTVQISTGSRYMVQGEVTDNIRHFEQCLDCMQIIGGDCPELNDEIPF